MDIFDITYSLGRVVTAIQRCDKIEVAAATTNITAWGALLGTCWAYVRQGLSDPHVHAELPTQPIIY